MASLYWVGGTGTWNSTAGTKWATTSGGAGGAAVPTAADDVFFDGIATGGGAAGAITVTLATNMVCRSINFTGFAGTFSHPVSTDFFIGDATAGAGNIALKFAAGMTYTLGSATTSTISFQSTSATAQTIDFAGKTCGLFTTGTGATGGSWVFGSSLVQNNASTLGHSKGTLDFNNLNHSVGGFSSASSNVRTINLGSGIITVTGATWSHSTSTNLTLNASTSSIVFNPTASVTPTFAMGTTGLVFYDVSIIKSAGGFSPSGSSATFHNFTQDNTVLGGGNRILQFDSGATITINGTLTYKSSNADSSRGRFKSNTPGTATTIALGASGTTSMTHIDFEDVAFTGTNLPVADTTNKRFANGGGNSGITFQSAVTYYWIAEGGATSQASHYSTSSGGSAGSVIPLLHDILVFDSNSITTASQTVINDLMRMPGLDFTNVLNSPVYNPRNSNGAANSVYGSLILKTGMTISAASAAGGTIPHTFAGRGNHTLSSGGNSWPNSMTFSNPNGTYALGDDFTINNVAASLSLSFGTFDANGHDVTTGLFSSSNSNVRTINMGSGTWTLTGNAGTIWNTATTTNLTVNASTSTVVCNYSGSTGTRTFAQGNAIAINNLNVTAGSDTFATNTTSGDFGGNVNFTGFTGIWNIGTNSIKKSLILGSGMTTTVGTNTLTFTATTSETITTNGVAIASHVTFNGTGGTWTLQDDFTIGSTKTFNLTAGTFSANNKNISVGLFSSSNSNTRTINMGSGTWTLTGTGTVWNISTNTGLTLAASTSTIVISDTSASTKLANFNSNGFNDLSITGGGSGSVTIQGTFTCRNITINAPKTVTFTNTTKTITGNFTALGSPGNIITLQSSSAGSAFTLSKASGIVQCDYLSIQDSTATGGAYWFAGANSTNVSGNTGWVFGAAAFPLSVADVATTSDATNRAIGKALSDSVTTSDTPTTNFTDLKDYFWFGGDNTGALTTGVQYSYIVPCMSTSWSSTETQRQIPISEDIIVTKMVVRIDTAPGVGKQWSFMLRDDGAFSPVSLTIADTATSATFTGTAAIAALSLLALECTPSGAPTAFTNWHVEIWYSTVGDKQLILGADSNTMSGTTTSYHNIHGGHGSAWATSPTDYQVPIPTDCTVTKMTLASPEGSPGTGKDFTASLRVNNTTDAISVTVNDSETIDTTTGSVDLVPGDVAVLKVVPNGTPTSRRLAWCMTVVPDIPGEMIFGYSSTAAPSTTADNYEQMFSVGNNGWNSTESVRLSRPPTAKYKKLYVELATAPGAAASGKSRTFTLRDNGVDTALAVTISETATTGNNTATVVIHTGNGNSGTWKATPTNTPAASSGVHIGYVAIAPTSSLNAAFNDSITTSDSVIKTVTKASSDAATASDTTAKTTTKPITDSSSISESSIRSPGVKPSDSVATTDGSIKAIGRRPSDTATASDSTVKSPVKKLIDSVDVNTTGKYLRFIGSDNSTNISTSATTATKPATPESDLTVAYTFDFRLHNYCRQSQIFSFGDRLDVNVEVGTNKVFFWFNEVGNIGTNLYKTPSSLIDGLFHNVIVTKDATSINVYLDGVLVGTKATTAFTANNAWTFTIGLTNVDIRDVRVWTRNLASGEIAGVANKSSIPRDQLSAEYLFTDQTGTTVTDSSGNSNNLTIGNINLVEWRSMSEVISLKPGLNKSDSATVSDTVSKKPGKVTADTAYAADYRRNLITNPSFETDMSSWNQYGGNPAASLAQSTDYAYVGTKSAKIINAPAASGGGYHGGMQYNFGALIVGRQYTVSAYVRGVAGGENVNIYIGQSDNPQQSFTMSNGWSRISLTFTHLGTGSDVYIRSGTANATWYADAVQLELGGSATPYFDGSMLGCGWEGTAHASVSASQAALMSVAKLLADAAIATDSRLPTLKKILSDSVTVTDARSVLFRKILADAATASDIGTPTLMRTLMFADAIVTIDAMSYVLLHYIQPASLVPAAIGFIDTAIRLGESSNNSVNLG